MELRQYDQMPVTIDESNAALGAHAAADLAEILKAAIRADGQAAVILATGNSQRTFIAALATIPGIAWDRITVFHMDEYLGMSEQHPASFRRWIRERLIERVQGVTFHGLAGDAPDVLAEIERYTALLDEHNPVACALGIGENGHLAFNDPPADFTTERSLQIVTLATAARQQQVGEGHFPTLADVPLHALSLTVPALLRPQHVLAIVPEARKAAAVQAALHGPVTPDHPASILRTQAHARLYLDPESAALL